MTLCKLVAEILQGSVMFKGNSRLCFGENTVNWEHILVGGRRNVANSTVPRYEKINCLSMSMQLYICVAV